MRGLLQTEPQNNQAKELEQLIDKAMKKGEASPRPPTPLLPAPLACLSPWPRRPVLPGHLSALRQVVSLPPRLGSLVSLYFVFI